MVPRIEFVTADDAKKKKQDDEDGLDLSLLGTSDDGSEIDTGVTSGADPSEWDPIEVEGRADGCDSNGGGGGANAPAICHTEKK